VIDSAGLLYRENIIIKIYITSSLCKNHFTEIYTKNCDQLKIVSAHMRYINCSVVNVLITLQS